MRPTLLDLRAEHWAEPIPPESHSLATDVVATFKQHIFDLTQRKQITEVHHHREADDLGRTVEIAERIFHPLTLRAVLLRINMSYFDNAV